LANQKQLEKKDLDERINNNKYEIMIYSFDDREVSISRTCKKLFGVSIKQDLDIAFSFIPEDGGEVRIFDGGMDRNSSESKKQFYTLCNRVDGFVFVVTAVNELTFHRFITEIGKLKEKVSPEFANFPFIVVVAAKKERIEKESVNMKDRFASFFSVDSSHVFLLDFAEIKRDNNNNNFINNKKKEIKIKKRYGK